MSEEDKELPVVETGDVKSEVDSSSTEAVKADSAASVDATSEPDLDRAALVKQLMQPDPVEEPEAKTEEPAVVAEDPDEELDEDDEKQKPAEKQVESSKDDDVDLADPSISEKTKKTVGRLRDRAKFGELITEVLTDAKISPQEFTAWTNLAARLKKGDPSAVAEVVATLKNFGYKEPVAAPAEVEPDLDGITERIFNSQFKEDVDSLLMDEAAARRHARKAAESAVKARQTAPAHSQSNNVPAQQQSQQRPMDPIRDRALQAIQQMEGDYRKKIPNYADIEESVSKRMIEEHGRGDPLMWTAGLQTIVQDEIRKRAKPPVVRQAIKPINETIVRPTPNAGKSAQGLTEREKQARSLM